jgi:LCP family protein required for cell wall assembly
MLGKSLKKWILIIGILIFALVAVAANYIYGSLNYKESLLGKQKENGPLQSDYKSEVGTTKNVLNILFLGIDKTEERESWLGVYRSDTIAFVRINLDNKKIKVLNIPRDTYAYIPSNNKFDKINHAYAFGSVNGNGVQASIEAINYLLGKNKKVVDYFFLMNMEPIPNIVDEIGGVTLDVEIDMKDHGANLSKGLQVLNGKQAFDYIHWRYSPGGDIDRIKRQQKFMSVLYKQQRDSGKILETLYIVLKHKNDIQTDFSMKQMIGLAKFMSDIPNGNITYYSIPGDGKMINNIEYWVPNESDTN